MAELICLQCGNQTYFAVQCEYYKAVHPTPSGLQVTDAIIEDWNYTEDSLRTSLQEIVGYVLQQTQVSTHPSLDRILLENPYIRCGACESAHVTLRSVPWQPTHPAVSLRDELRNHHHEYLHLRKEGLPYADRLP